MVPTTATGMITQLEFRSRGAPFRFPQTKVDVSSTRTANGARPESRRVTIDFRPDWLQNESAQPRAELQPRQDAAPQHQPKQNRLRATASTSIIPARQSTGSKRITWPKPSPKHEVDRSEPSETTRRAPLRPSDAATRFTAAAAIDMNGIDDSKASSLTLTSPSGTNDTAVLSRHSEGRSQPRPKIPPHTVVAAEKNERRTVAAKSATNAGDHLELATTDVANLESALPDAVEHSGSVASKQLDVVARPVGAWPDSVALRDLLAKLADRNAAIADWSAEIDSTLDQLRAASDIAAPEVTEHLRRLSRLSRQSPQLESRQPIEFRVLLRRISYALDRRIEVWKAAVQLAVQHRSSPRDVRVVDAYGTIKEADNRIEQHPYAVAWRNYLMIDKLVKISTETWVTDPTARREVATKVLERMRDAELTNEQSAFLNQQVFHKLQQHLVEWAEPATDITNVLNTIEQFEQSRGASVAESIVSDMNSLAYSQYPAAKSLQHELNKHYRNANVRLTVTGSLLNELLPVLQPIQQRIRDTILGADVTGKTRRGRILTCVWSKPTIRFGCVSTRMAPANHVRFRPRVRFAFYLGTTLTFGPAKT